MQVKLPVIDRHCVEVAAGAEDAWRSLVEILPTLFAGWGKGAFTRALGCEERSVTGPSPIAEGSTFPGFRVVDASPPRLVAEGRHRFSSYALIFDVEKNGEGARICAETMASFPGVQGGVYRALVIGTGAHVVAVRRILRAIKQRTEASAP
ncbi:MAG: hypothetical protein ACRDKB_05860 [Actinomycetota bacterium]